jgi:ABC-type uncharacterized transport system permease subunit
MGPYTFVVSILSVSVALAAPLLLAALGGLISIRAGVLNIGLEGLMLLGAFVACAVSAATGSAWLGMLVAGVAGAIGGAIYAYIAVYRRGNQVVVGLGINILAAGLTGYVLRLYPPAGDISQVVSFGPLLASARSVPLVGPLIFSQTAPVLLTFLLVPLVSFLLYHTNWGLAVRGCGDEPVSVDALGHDVLKVQRQAVIWGAVLAAIGGSVLSLCYVNVFTEEMTGGRGFLALAAFIFGRWTPAGTLIACLIFAAGDALQYQLQVLQFNVPYQLMIALPYVLAMIAMIFFAGGTRSPRAVGLAFIPDRHSR